MVQLEINNIKIPYTKEDDEYFIAVKPICEILNISFSTQRRVIKEHVFYSRGVFLMNTTGADGKDYKMVCLSEKYILSWILGIDIRKVNSNSKDDLYKLQEECHDVLRHHFVAQYIEEAEKRHRRELMRKELKKLDAEIKEMEAERMHGVTTLKMTL
ncbi:MAG: phage antirepressor N-terminal domain-containing protein [Bacteroidota bacterium]